MGNSSGNAGLAIVPDRRNVVAGEEVTGTINIQVKERVNGQLLMLRMIGKEMVFNSNSHLKNQAFVCRKEILIFEWPSRKIEVGQYSFPFALVLPDDLPNSFDYQGKAVLKYYVKGVVLSQKKEKIVADSCEIQVLKYYRSAIQSIYNNNSFSLRGCLCSKGQVTVGAHMNKDAYFPNETGGLTIEIDNSQSRTEITQFLVGLKRVVTWNQGGGTISRAQDHLYTLSLNRTIRKGDSLLSDHALSMDIPFNRFQERIEKAASLKGNIITCQYFVEISLVFGSCVAEKHFAIGVNLYPEEAPMLPHPHIPDNWNPSIMPIQRASLNEAWEYQPTAPVFTE